jgi:hypothetical protein
MMETKRIKICQNKGECFLITDNGTLVPISLCTYEEMDRFNTNLLRRK